MQCRGRARCARRKKAEELSPLSRQKEVSSGSVYCHMKPVAVLHELLLPTEGKLDLFLDGRGYDSAQRDGGGGEKQ